MKDFLRKLAEYTALHAESGTGTNGDVAYGSVFSGILGEARLGEWLKNNRIAAFQDRILRVGGRDYEMDFLVVAGSTVFAVEVKNWHGKVTPTKDGRYYVQTNSHGVIKHPNTVEKTKRYASYLAAQLAAEGFGDIDVRALTVFVNSHCYLDRRILSSGAVYMDDLDGDTFTGGDAQGELQGVAEYLSTLPTWDRLICSDGTVIKGKLVTRSIKLLDCAKNEKTVYLNDVALFEVESNRFLHNLERVKLTYLDGGSEELYCEGGKLIMKNPAKNFNETAIQLARVKSLKINYR